MALTFKPFIIVEVYESDGTTLIAELPRRWDVSGSEPLNVPGVGTITVRLEDPVIYRHPGILSMGNWVKFWLGDGLGHGDYVHAFQIRQRKTRFRGTAEAIERVRTVSGPTAHALLDDFMVKHEVQPPRPDASENRAYTWTAPPGEWYRAAQWTDTITSAGRWDSHITVARSGKLAAPAYKPVDWPDPASEWVRVIGGGEWQFFRTQVDIPAGGLLCKLFLTADEICRGFIDGDLVISRDEYENGYEGFSEYKTFLPEGLHYISVLMRSKATPGGDGVDGFLMCLADLKVNGKVNTILRRSREDFWDAHAGLPVPGWRQSEILRSQVQEAQVRNNRSADMLTIDFTQNLDSNGDPWNLEVSRTMRIGTSILDSQQQLSELGEFDVWVDPANFQLKAWLMRGLDMSNSVTLEVGRNLLDWDVDEKDSVKNVALIKYDGGWVTYTASKSVDEYGGREVGISLGAIGDDDTAATIAMAHIEKRKHARRRGGAADEVSRDHDDQPSAAIIASPGTVPGIDYRTGSWLKVPSGTGVRTKQRLMGMTFAENDITSQVTFDPEFAEEDPEEMPT